jgi:hypothetical protein
LRLALSKGPHRVHAATPPPFPLFYLKTEAEPASETLFFKGKKHWTIDKVQKQDSSKFSTYISLADIFHFNESLINVAVPFFVETRNVFVANPTNKLFYTHLNL